MRTPSLRRAIQSVVLASALALALPAAAADLKIAVAADITTMDPHFFNLFPNNALGDGVGANDKPFLSTFPYVAAPWAGTD